MYGKAKGAMGARLGWGWFLLAGLVPLAGCMRPVPPVPPASPLVEMPAPAASAPAYRGLRRLAPAEFPRFSDDGDKERLLAALRQSASYYQRQPPEKIYVVGQDTFTAAHMIASLEAFETIVLSTADWQAEIADKFWVYQSTGLNEAADVTYSSYYEHTLKASLRRSKAYRYPIYKRPSDLIEVDFGAFDPTRAGERMTGRMVRQKLVPYYTRREIDSGKVLAGRGLEIAWAMDPLDVFYLQVEGSGWLELPDHQKPVRVRYAANNGRKYRSVGLWMIEQGLIPREKFNRASMEEYLRSHPDKRQNILNQNPRYVFFHLDRSTMSHLTLGSLQVPLTPYRSVATDPAIFPPGSLSWIQVPGEPAVARFVVSQDEGGAIKGPGRVDYFAGSGKEAEDFAFAFWRPGGKLYLLVKKAGGNP